MPSAKTAESRPARRSRTGDERGRPSGRNRARRQAPARRRGGRYAVVHDLSGPKVRLGILWFGAAFAAIAGGPLATAVVYGVVGAAAGAQVARCWRKRRLQANELVAAALGGLMALGACLGAGGAGIALLACVGAAFFAVGAERRSTNPRIADIGATIQSGLPVGVAVMSMVLLCRLDQGSALGLLLLVSGYETGDFLIGSGARNPYEGPAAGGSAIVVITFILSTLPISALDFGEAWLFGGLTLLLAPLGQIFASAILPAATAPASALRRLDSLLLAAPVWCLGVGLLT